MQRTVSGADGREWTVHGTFEWRTPATSDDFEHDVSVGNTAAIVLLVLVLTLGTILITWSVRTDDVVVPPWVVVLVMLAILFFPTRWALRRSRGTCLSRVRPRRPRRRRAAAAR